MKPEAVVVEEPCRGRTKQCPTLFRFSYYFKRYVKNPSLIGSLQGRALSEAEAKDKGERVSNHPLVSKSCCCCCCLQSNLPYTHPPSPKQALFSNSSQRATRREGGSSDPLIPFLIYFRSFLNHLNFQFIFNLIQQPGTTHNYA